MINHGSPVFADPIPDGVIALVANGFSAGVGGGGDAPFVRNNPVDRSQIVKINVDDGLGDSRILLVPMLSRNSDEGPGTLTAFHEGLDRNEIHQEGGSEVSPAVGRLVAFDGGTCYYHGWIDGLVFGDGEIETEVHAVTAENCAEGRALNYLQNSGI